MQIIITIATTIKNEYTGMGPHILQATGGAKLMVMEDDAEKSLDILDNYDSE